MRLEELKRGMLVEGVYPDGAVTLRDVESDGDGTVEVIFKDASGRIGERLLFRSDEANRTPTPPPIPGGADGGSGGGVGGEGPDGGGIAQPPVPPEPAQELSRSFHGVVEIDPARLGGSAGAISQEVVQRLASIMGSNVRVTLEIRADVPDGIPEKVERDVTENCNTLRFREHGFGE